jgi:hypothetical protein
LRYSVCWKKANNKQQKNTAQLAAIYSTVILEIRCRGIFRFVGYSSHYTVYLFIIEYSTI